MTRKELTLPKIMTTTQSRTYSLRETLTFSLIKSLSQLLLVTFLTGLMMSIILYWQVRKARL